MASGGSGIDCFIACPRCIKAIPDTQSAYSVSSSNGHKCSQTVLLARVSGAKLLYKIRDRTYQKSATTTLSTSALSVPPRHCDYNDMICTYAHNALELSMWQMETDGKRNVFEIISKHRQVGLNTLDNLVSYFVSKFGGWLRCICSICSHKRAEDGSTCCGPEGHNWNENQVLVHYSLSETPSETPESSALVERPGDGRRLPVLCNLLQGCPDKEQSCAKCHSFIERDFAYVKQHLPPSSTMEEICQKFNDMKMKVASRLVYRDPQIPTQESHGFQFAVICRECYKSRIHESRQDGSSACSHKHPWELNSSAAALDVSTGNWIPIKQLPRTLPKDPSRLGICRNMAKNRFCPYLDECQFAHSKLEKDVWTWQITSQPKGVTCSL